jgi:hypothetical protein
MAFHIALTKNLQNIDICDELSYFSDECLKIGAKSPFEAAKWVDEPVISLFVGQGRLVADQCWTGNRDCRIWDYGTRTVFNGALQARRRFLRVNSGSKLVIFQLRARLQHLKADPN